MKKYVLIIFLLAFINKNWSQTIMETDSKREMANLRSNETFKLFQNYPNPAKENAVIRFQLNTAGTVSFKVMDVLGNPVRETTDQFLNAGVYSIVIETNDLKEGMYFYTLKKDGISQSM